MAVLLFAARCLLGSPAAAATPFCGEVRERGSRDPIAGVRVTVSPPGGPSRQAVTDERGRFCFSDLPAPPARVRLGGLAVLPQEAAAAAVYYAVRRTDPFSTVVRAEPRPITDVSQTLNIDEIKHLPGNYNDPINAVQNLPGVARSPYGLGVLAVWGASPGDTRFYVDGVPIPRLYHFAFRSTLNPEFVSTIDFRPGVYGADFGRGLGGMIEIETRPLRSEQVHGAVTIDLLDGALRVEGRLHKKVHFAVAARASWAQFVLPAFLPAGVSILPFYYDYQLALSYTPTPRDELDLFLFGSTDDISARLERPDLNLQSSLDDGKSYYSRLRLRWRRRLAEGGQLQVMAYLGGETVRGSGVLSGTPVEYESPGLGYGLRAELRQRVRPQLEFSAGLDVEGMHQDLPTVRIDGRDPGPLVAQALAQTWVEQRLQLAPYVIARFLLWGERLAVLPQLRAELTYLHAPAGTERILGDWEPRLLIRLGLVGAQRLVLKAGAGIFHQLNVDRGLTVPGQPTEQPAYGATYSLGAEARPTATLQLEADGFYRDLRSLPGYSPDTLDPNPGQGRAYGVQVLVRQQLWHGLMGWVAYTLSRSERKESPTAPWAPFVYDQTHILTVFASYRLPYGFEAGLRFRYVTGNPYTPNVGATRDLDYQYYFPIQGAPLSARLPDFHQLDLRVDKTFTFARWRLGLYLDVQNIYYQQNPELRITGGRQLAQVGYVSGIPTLPVLGMRADF